MLEQITFCQCTNFRVHEVVYSTCAHKNSVLISPSCAGAKISAKTPLCQVVYKIQIRTNPQCLISTIDTFNSLFCKAIPCKLVQYLVPMCYMLRFERAPCMCFCFGCDKADLRPLVKYSRCWNWKKIIHMGLLHPRSQVLFTVAIA